MPSSLDVYLASRWGESVMGGMFEVIMGLGILVLIGWAVIAILPTLLPFIGYAIVGIIVIALLGGFKK